MAQMVTIEGSVTPSAELPKGQRRTVQYTDRIQRLVARGYVVIVDGPHDADETVALDPIPVEHQLPPADGQPHIAEGTGEPNIGIEAPADGSWVEMHGDGSEHAVPIVPQHPDETAQPSPAMTSDADPKAPTTVESGTGG